jgi:8-oxo-dGTP diphosphatase
MTSPDPPATELVRVVAAVVRREDRYLLGRRPATKRHGGLWEFPGGKIDPGETLLDAARRELAEELILEVVRVGSVLLSVADGTSRFVIEFVEVRAEGTPVALEHDELGWFTPDELAGLPLAPADARFAAYLRQGATGAPEPPGS